MATTWAPFGREKYRPAPEDSQNGPPMDNVEWSRSDPTPQESPLYDYSQGYAERSTDCSEPKWLRLARTTHASQRMCLSSRELDWLDADSGLL
jgi:hypothetical protein